VLQSYKQLSNDPSLLSTSVLILPKYTKLLHWPQHCSTANNLHHTRLLFAVTWEHQHSTIKKRQTVTAGRTRCA